MSFAKVVLGNTAYIKEMSRPGAAGVLDPQITDVRTAIDVKLFVVVTQPAVIFHPVDLSGGKADHFTFKDGIVLGQDSYTLWSKTNYFWDYDESYS